MTDSPVANLLGGAAEDAVVKVRGLHGRHAERLGGLRRRGRAAVEVDDGRHGELRGMVHLLLRGLLLLLRRGGGQERRHKEHKTHASHPGRVDATIRYVRTRR